MFSNPKLCNLLLGKVWLGNRRSAPACDSFGFVLTNIDGTPGPRAYLSLLYKGFPKIIDSLPGGMRFEAEVLPKGCIADGKCKSIATGKIRLDAEHDPAGKQISGQYEIGINGQHLTGQFLATRRVNKHPPRICE
jgi:hypothetical protein